MNKRALEETQVDHLHGGLLRVEEVVDERVEVHAALDRRDVQCDVGRRVRPRCGCSERRRDHGCVRG